MADAVAKAQSDVALHPLVIINISDHITRLNANGASAATRVLGVLYGCQVRCLKPRLYISPLTPPLVVACTPAWTLHFQTGRKIELHNSFEMTYEVGADGHVVLDLEYLRDKADKCT
jgi:hypothetical protein